MRATFTSKSEDFPWSQLKGHHTAEVAATKNPSGLVLHQYRNSKVWGSYQHAGLSRWRGAHATNPRPFA